LVAPLLQAKTQVKSVNWGARKEANLLEKNQAKVER
jgi:hypothetical protein